ncbi:hypothetical protein BAUCODRAFT_56010, partial [Baudoinia panamericana UAMH 10762]
DPVLVCIDCEAFEHAQQKITELGVAVLDTRDIDLHNVDASSSTSNSWVAKMKYAHYRPIEYANLRNKNFIKGCAESFNFGTTTWIRVNDGKQLLKRLFAHPTHLPQLADFAVTPPTSEPRNVVFVAHGASNDTAYLKQLGFDMTADAEVIRTVDTQLLAGGSKKHGVSLHRLMLALEVEAVNLHNAGNDAAYTLQAMVLMA